MSVHQDDTRKVTTHRLREMKLRSEKISMLTSYDYSMANNIAYDFGSDDFLEFFGNESC